MIGQSLEQRMRRSPSLLGEMSELFPMLTRLDVNSAVERDYIHMQFATGHHVSTYENIVFHMNVVTGDFANISFYEFVALAKAKLRSDYNMSAEGWRIHRYKES